MRIRLHTIFACLLCLCTVFCFASKNQEAFLLANKLYQEKQYKKAFDLYASIKNKGYATFFNMGNCAFCLENTVDAILYWNKAKKVAPWSKYEAIDYNIAIAYDQLEICPDETFIDELYMILNLFSLFSLQIVFLLFWFCFFLSFFLLKRLRTLILSVFLCFSICMSVILMLKYQTRNYPMALVKSSILMLSGPNKNFHEIAKLSAADKVIVQKMHKNWYKIKRGGVTGWILSDGVEII